MYWLDVTEWHPVNNDIIPNDNYEDNTLLPSNRETEKVLSNPTVDEFISTGPNPQNLKTMNPLLLMIQSVTKIICI